MALALLDFVSVRADGGTRLFAGSGSKATIAGDNNLHAWRIAGEIIDGWMEVGTGFPLVSGQRATLGALPAHIEVSIPVRSLHDNEGTDSLMRRMLKAEPEPRIVFHSDHLALTALPTAKDSSYKFEAQGYLVVAGITNQISLPLSLLPRDGNEIRITGGMSAKMSSFGIAPPHIRIGDRDDAVKYRDEVQVSIEWIVGPKP